MTPSTVSVQFPPVAVALPSDVAPSKTSTDEPASAVPETVTFALPSSWFCVGCAITGAPGAVTSITNVLLFAVPVFFAASTARTSSVCVPSLCAGAV